MKKWYEGLEESEHTGKKVGRVRVTKSKLWKAIRQQCLACVCNSAREVELCTAPRCSLYLYRFGRALEEDDPEYIAGSTNKYRVKDKVMEYLAGKGWQEAKAG